MISVEKLYFAYPGACEATLRDLSFRVDAGEAIALVGAAGAGKSSLLRVLAGFVPSLVRGERRGQLRVDGIDPGMARPAERVRRAGLLFSDPSSQLSGICPTVREEVAWGLGNLGVAREEMKVRVNGVLSRLRLEDLAERSPFTLSGGQQQRVALAAVLALAPRVLLLDEPVAMLDPQGRHEVLQAAVDLASEGHVVVWATPHLEEAASFSRWLVLDQGRLVQDGPAAIPASHGAQEAPWTRLARNADRVGLWRGAWPVREDQAVEGLRR